MKNRENKTKFLFVLLCKNLSKYSNEKGIHCAVSSCKCPKCANLYVQKANIIPAKKAEYLSPGK